MLSVKNDHLSNPTTNNGFKCKVTINMFKVIFYLTFYTFYTFYKKP